MRGEIGIKNLTGQEIQHVWEEYCVNGKLSIGQAYRTLSPSSQQQLHWWPLIKKNSTTPKTVFMVRMLAHQKLSIITRLARWGIDVDSICKLCGSNPESHQHLFSECSFSMQLRLQVMRRFAQNSLLMDLQQKVVVRVLQNC